MDQRHHRRAGDRAAEGEPFERTLSAAPQIEELQLGAPGRAAGDGERNQRSRKSARVHEEREPGGADELPVHRDGGQSAEIHRATDEGAAKGRTKNSGGRGGSERNAGTKNRAAGSEASARSAVETNRAKTDFFRVRRSCSQSQSH